MAVVADVVQHLEITWPPQFTTVLGIGLKRAKNEFKSSEYLKHPSWLVIKALEFKNLVTIKAKIRWQSKQESGDNKSMPDQDYLAMPITPQAARAPAFPVDLESSWPPCKLKINKLEERTLKLKRGEHLSKVILVSMDDHGASYNGVLPREGQEGVSDVNLLKQNQCLVMMMKMTIPVV